MDTKDVTRNFSSKATSMKVPLLKSTIHHDASSSKSSHSDGNFNNWHVPSHNFGNVCCTLGYWEWVEDFLPRHKDIWISSKPMTLHILLCSRTTMTIMYSMLLVNFGVCLRTHFLLSLERCPYQFGIYKPLQVSLYKGIFMMKSFPW